MKIQISDGQFVVGILQAFTSEPWANDPNKFNNRLVIARNFVDKFGNEQPEYTTLDIHSEDVGRVEHIARQLKGKRVIVNAFFSIRSDLNRAKPYAFLSIRLPKGAEISEVSAPSPEQLKSA